MKSKTDFLWNPGAFFSRCNVIFPKAKRYWLALPARILKNALHQSITVKMCSQWEWMSVGATGRRGIMALCIAQGSWTDLHSWPLGFLTGKTGVLQGLLQRMMMPWALKSVMGFILWGASLLIFTIFTIFILYYIFTILSNSGERFWDLFESFVGGALWIFPLLEILPVRVVMVADSIGKNDQCFQNQLLYCQRQRKRC